MAKTVFLPEENLDAWVKALAADHTVLAPVRDREAIVFGEVNDASNILLDQQPPSRQRRPFSPRPRT
ncbi:hypothetical protein [Salidesulfovibrio brasiliensis]|uniref:hypothetical protein n=1 Tax=Salidesulfovibrio brasiliensis TaxID=221711 RepID=UPI000A5309AD|nr:hypothetical protein [Salidesulfovibrio brasiliensis]